MDFFNPRELGCRIALNFDHLQNDPYYQIEHVFSPADYEWYGDKEGRALLAFVCHYKIHGRTIPCMHEMLARMPQMTNEKQFFGPLAGEVIHEQQLSGHSWLLRGLCEYYEQFGDESVLQAIRSICRELYLPIRGRIGTYPVNRPKQDAGGVSGKSVQILNGWKLSSDVGCAFMSIDGLSHAYALLLDADLLALLDEMIDFYLSIDKLALRVQTHCTLTAARGMMRLYALTADRRYLEGAKSIYTLYTEAGGMTATYQNANWWGRDDTWTEPCAIVDSLMLACELYKIEGLDAYRTTAARIWHNGLATAQRANGGAGTDTVVTHRAGGTTILQSKKYEAYFCCTMRLAEGLWYAYNHIPLLTARRTGTVTRQADGTYADGDILYAEITGGDAYLTNRTVCIDGIRLHPLLKYYTVPKEDMEQITQRVLFD